MREKLVSWLRCGRCTRPLRSVSSSKRQRRMST
jgi:hypothetical protein